MNLHRNMYLSPVHMSLYVTINAFLVRSQRALQFWYVKLYIKLNFGRENKCLRIVRGALVKSQKCLPKFFQAPKWIQVNSSELILLLSPSSLNLISPTSVKQALPISLISLYGKKTLPKIRLSISLLNFPSLYQNSS